VSNASVPASYLECVWREFRRTRQLADDAMAQLTEAELFLAPGPEENSIAVIVKHLAGNLLSRWTDFLTTDGEKPDRNRDGEFELASADTGASLRSRWEDGWARLFATLEALRPEDLSRTVFIRGEAHSVVQAIERQASHYAYHAGQIVLLARRQRGPAWRSLSIPRKGSVAFNQDPKPYLGPGSRS
jgi:hypothetical protein